MRKGARGRAAGTEDSYQLERIAADHAIGAEVLIPFAIERLQQHGRNESALDMRLRDIGAAGERRRTLRLRWAEASVPGRPAAIDARSVTEWAACAVACVVMSAYAGLRVLAVSADGDAFDYWVGNDERELGLEVSGTLLEDVDARHQAKVRQ